ncbi:MAG: cytochrome P450 [Pseudomonas sp.]|uniref:cytochrome P450 n=1 Tax=Pseudomonas sp. TaxID=306 RepID=UPI0039821583
MDHEALLKEPPLPTIAREQIIDFDFFSIAPVDGDIHLGWKRLHEGPDVFYTPRNGGHWVITRAADIAAIFHDAARFSNAGVAMSRDAREMRFAPGEADPPEHTAYRALLSPSFGPRQVRALEQQARTIAVELIDGFRADGGCEFRTAFSQRMPIYVFLSLMQLPWEDAAVLLPAADWLTRDPDPESFMRAIQTMMGYLAERIAERRLAPRDDFISQMIGADVGGRRATEQEVLSMTANVMFGGLDTVTSTMGFFIHFLARSPAHRRRLVEDPDAVGNAVDELLRRHAIANFGRCVIDDMEYLGVPMRRGDLVLLPTALHNLDERRFPDPLTVDFDRQDKAHFTFGGGIHRCLGSHLARLQLRVMLEEWLVRIPDFRIEEGKDVHVHSGRVNAITYLPLRWS